MCVRSKGSYLLNRELVHCLLSWFILDWRMTNITADAFSLTDFNGFLLHVIALYGVPLVGGTFEEHFEETCHIDRLDLG
jgi:hypothetical protein